MISLRDDEDDECKRPTYKVFLVKVDQRERKRDVKGLVLVRVSGTLS